MPLPTPPPTWKKEQRKLANIFLYRHCPGDRLFLLTDTASQTGVVAWATEATIWLHKEHGIVLHIDRDRSGNIRKLFTNLPARHLPTRPNDYTI